MAIEFSQSSAVESSRSGRGSPTALGLSTPSPPRSPIGASSELTNTLIIASVPKALFKPEYLHPLRDFFETYGRIIHWAPLTSFGRILVVYADKNEAEQVKLSYPKGIELPDMGDIPKFTLFVYRADPTPLGDVPDAERYLQPPEPEKNFLISPPGSPPVGWESTREGPPNADPLAHDLIAALKQLELHIREEDENGEKRRKRGSKEVIMEADSEVGMSIYVENCDEEQDEEDAEEAKWVYGESRGSRTPIPAWKPVATAMPPIQVS